MTTEFDDLVVSDGAVGADQRGLHIFDLANIAWVEPEPRESTDPDAAAVTMDEGAGVWEKFLIRPQPGDDRPLIEMLRFPPNYSFPPHWHTEGEFICVLTGGLNFGGQVLGPGEMAYADARCVYGSESAGPQGCDFLLIRRGWSKTTLVE